MNNRRLGLALEWIRRTARTEDSGVPDADLLERFLASKDTAAFELLAWRHQRLVFGVCLRVLRDIHDAEDAFQAAFLVLARKARTIGRRESLAAWLYKVAYRCALTVRAARSRRTGREQPLGATDLADPGVGMAPSEQRELQTILDEELSRLPERFRAPAVLCYLAGKTVEEAAAQLGCPRGTVASRLARARERLRIRLVGRGLVLPAGLTALALCDAGYVAAASEALVPLTIQVVKLQAAGAAASAGPAAVAERVLRAMFLRKLAMGVAVIAAFAGVFLAGGMLSVRIAAQPPEVRQPDKKGAAPEKQVQAPAARQEQATPAGFQDFLGHLDASQEIQLASRVAGELEKIHIKEGADVKKGDLLFEIDARGARLEVEQALANLAQAEARHKLAANAFERGKRLMVNKSISREEFDQMDSDVAVAAAVLNLAQANVARARLTLASHQIIAPIAGRVTRLHVDAGNLVAAGGAKALATLVVVDPLALRFNMDERTFLRYQKLKQSGQDKNIEIHFAILAADEKGFPHKAALEAVRPVVDPATGVIVVRATVANPERLLLPGMAVRVRLTFPK